MQDFKMEISFIHIEHSVYTHLLMPMDSSSVMGLQKMGVSSLPTSYVLLQETELGLTRAKLVSR